MRKEELIPGRWYRHTTSKGWYGKIASPLSVDSTAVELSEHITDNNKYTLYGRFAYRYLELMESIDEIMDFLPKNHPDKIPSEKMQEHLTRELERINTLTL